MPWVRSADKVRAEASKPTCQRWRSARTENGSLLSGIVHLWDLKLPAPASAAVELRGHEGSIQALAISPRGDWLVTASQDHTARLWHLPMQNLLDVARSAAGRKLTSEERKQFLLDSE